MISLMYVGGMDNPSFHDTPGSFVFGLSQGASALHPWAKRDGTAKAPRTPRLLGVSVRNIRAFSTAGLCLRSCHIDNVLFNFLYLGVHGVGALWARVPS